MLVGELVPNLSPCAVEKGLSPTHCLTNTTMWIRLALFSLSLAVASAQECTADGKLCDTHERCNAWKAEGECFKNAIYMKEKCPAACADEDYPTKQEAVCKDYHLRCPVWANLGECAENPTNMKRYCPLSCGICKDPNFAGGEVDSDDPLCVDLEAQCGFWASRGECSANPGFMHLKCSKSCGTCEINKKKEAKKTGGATSSDGSAAKHDLTDDDKKVIRMTSDFGEEQTVAGSESAKTLEILRASIPYMNQDVPSLPPNIQDKW